MTTANLSGGRDSTAMVIKWLEMGREIDYIIFCDTGYEFSAMYEYIDKIDGYLQRNFNKKITRLNASQEFERWAFEKPIERGERAGRLRGLPMTLSRDYCTRETKIRPTTEFIKQLSPCKYHNEALIGYTAAEVARGRTSSLNYAIARYPLHELGWNEKEVSDFLAARGIMNPLYERFSRTGCFFCPKQSINSLYQLWRNYPREWRIMREWENRAKALNCVNQRWHLHYTMDELESKFKAQGEPLFEPKIAEFNTSETCFCLR